jgi:hypothetical protein
MFDVYFCPRVSSRLWSNPDAALLETFLVHLHRREHARLVIQNYVRAAELFLRWLRHKRRPWSTVTEFMVRRFAGRGRPGRQPRANSHAALRHLLRFLRQRGSLPEQPSQMPRAIARIVAAFDAHLRDVAGLSSATRLYRRRYAGQFLRSVFGDGPVCWSRLRLTPIPRGGRCRRNTCASADNGRPLWRYSWIAWRTLSDSGSTRPRLDFPVVICKVLATLSRSSIRTLATSLTRRPRSPRHTASA